MIVKELISELKKMPQDAKVYTADHDHSGWETNGAVRCVELCNQSEMGDYTIEYLERNPYFKIKDNYVTIRP